MQVQGLFKSLSGSIENQDANETLYMKINRDTLRYIERMKHPWNVLKHVVHASEALVRNLRFRDFALEKPQIGNVTKGMKST